MSDSMNNDELNPKKSIIYTYEFIAFLGMFMIPFLAVFVINRVVKGFIIDVLSFVPFVVGFYFLLRARAKEKELVQKYPNQKVPRTTFVSILLWVELGFVISFCVIAAILSIIAYFLPW